MVFRVSQFLGSQTTAQIVLLPVEQRKRFNFVYDSTFAELRMYAVNAEAYPSVVIGTAGTLNHANLINRDVDNSSHPTLYPRIYGRDGSITSFAALNATYVPGNNYENHFAYVTPVTGLVPDAFYQCQKQASGAFTWVLVAVPEETGFIKNPCIIVFGADEDVVLGNVILSFLVPFDWTQMDLVDVIVGSTEAGQGANSTDVNIRRVRQAAPMGDSTTQFDITNPGGNTFRYTYDGTGTDPDIDDSDASLRIGDHIDIAAQNFNANNNGHFVLTGVGLNYFEVTNAAGAVESNKTIGTGYIQAVKHRYMLLSPAFMTAGQYYARSNTTSPTLKDVLPGDQLFPDVLNVTGTPPKGLVVTMSFKRRNN